MASLIIDRQSGEYWLYFGQGTTKDRDKAYRYADTIAVTLHHLFWESTYVEHLNPAGPSASTFTSYTPKSKVTPMVTTSMKDNNLIWIACEGVWVAAERQHLALSSLAAWEQKKVTG